MTGRALFCAARNLALLQEYCAQQGTKFLFVCAPNKNTSYPEYMPGQYRKTEQVSDLDRLEQALTQQGVSFCDLREALSGRESLTYYRTDSHWNGYGSYLAGRQILQALGKEADTEDVSLSMAQHAAIFTGCSIRRPTGRRMRLPRRSCARFPISAMCAGRTIS